MDNITENAFVDYLKRSIEAQDRIATALEVISETLAGMQAERQQPTMTGADAPVAITVVEPVAAAEPAVSLLTLDQLKLVSQPFRVANQLSLVKSCLVDMGVSKISELESYTQQKAYLVMVKDKARLLDEVNGNAVITTINNLIGA